MSEQNSSAWPFPGMEEGEELDISAIFGGGNGNDSNPFDLPAAQDPVPDQADPITEPTAEPAMEPLAEPVAEPTAPSAAAVNAEQPKTQREPAPQAQEPAVSAEEPSNIIQTAFAQQEEKTAQTATKSLFEKLPVFSYGSAKDEITDGAMTFEELRIAKSDDFPELGEGKRVSWSVEYGKVTKQITDPKGTTISPSRRRSSGPRRSWTASRSPKTRTRPAW